MSDAEDWPAPFTIARGRRLKGRITQLFLADGADFVTRAVPRLALDYEGIRGDRHAGITRRATGREPWYARGSDMRNERQLTLLCPRELERIAERMEIKQIAPEWIGGNMLLEGIAHLSMLPPRTLLFFENGAVLRIDGQNAPCRVAGGEIAKHYPQRQGLDLLFPQVARRLRGLVAWVERPGAVSCGEKVEARVPEQWIYAPE